MASVLIDSIIVVWCFIKLGLLVLLGLFPLKAILKFWNETKCTSLRDKAKFHF